MSGAAEPFAAFIRALPVPDATLPPSMRAWLLGAEGGLAMFYEIPDGATVPEHAHGAQWGVVLAGSFDLITAEETRTFRAGETYSVEAGVLHTAVMHPGYVGVDVFADADRYDQRPATE
jgi:quercetin dioxygenase-like cupin family protein